MVFTSDQKLKPRVMVFTHKAPDMKYAYPSDDFMKRKFIMHFQFQREPELSTVEHSTVELSTVELSTVELSTVEFSTESWNIRQ